MVENLMQFLEGKEAQGFEPRPYYSADGDFLVFYFREEEALGERVDELLTVYRGIGTKELVGCKIKGVRRLVEKLRSFGVWIESENNALRLGLLFLSAAVNQSPELQHYYEEMGRFSKNVSLDPAELQLV
jgi:hypothetical protein